MEPSKRTMTASGWAQELARQRGAAFVDDIRIVEGEEVGAIIAHKKIDTCMQGKDDRTAFYPKVGAKVAYLDLDIAKGFMVLWPTVSGSLAGGRVYTSHQHSDEVQAAFDIWRERHGVLNEDYWKISIEVAPEIFCDPLPYVDGPYKVVAYKGKLLLTNYEQHGRGAKELGNLRNAWSDYGDWDLGNCRSSCILCGGDKRLGANFLPLLRWEMGKRQGKPPKDEEEHHLCNSCETGLRRAGFVKAEGGE